MKMKNKKMLLFLIPWVCLFMFVGSFSISNAQENQSSTPTSSGKIQVVTVATVGIHDSKIISQDENKIKVSFDLFNGEKSQPDIRYSVAIIKNNENNQVLIDEKIYDEEISLNENETLNREIVYSAPAWLNGKYDLVIFAKSSSGLDLAVSPVGEVIFSGTGQYVEIKKETCYLKIKGDESGVKYSLIQGVDITKDENLVLSCVVKNNYAESIIASPEFITHQGSVFGKIVEAKKGFYEPIVIASMEEKEISYEIPKAKESRAYDISMKLVGKNGEISNEIISHYIVQGQIGIIKNIRLDKDYYQKGDIAKILFDWSPLVNSFQNSRTRTNFANQVFEVEISIKNKESKACIELKQVDLKNQVQVNLDFQVIEDCQNPVIIASLKDMQGNIVDSKELRVESKNIPPKKTGSNSILFAIIVLAALLVVLTVILLVFKKKTNSRVGMFLVGILFSSVLFFSMGNRVMASTFSIYNDYGPLTCTYWSDSCDGGCPYCVEWWGGIVEVGQVTVNLNKSTYSPGESIVTSGSFKNLVDDFGETVLDLTSTINGVTSSMLHYTSANRNNVYIASATNTPAQALGGAFNATFVGSQYTPDFRTNFTWYFSGASASASIPYTVTCGPPPANATGTACSFSCNSGYIWDGASGCIAAPCNLPWGGTIASGSNVTAYSSSSVSCGSTCSSQTRTCTNGTLSGTYTKQSCSVSSCASCNLPWGGTIASGSSITAYSTDCGTCSTSQTRTCTNGTLSGTYTNQSCSPVCSNCPASTTSWTVSPNTCSGPYALISHNASRIISNTAAGKSGAVTLTCNNGSVAQSGKTCATCGTTAYSNLNCAVAAPGGTYVGLPANYTVGTNASYSYNSCTGVYTYTSGCSAPAAFSCTAPPTNGILFATADNTTVLANTTSIYSATDNVGVKCEYYCNSPYTPASGACECAVTAGTWSACSASCGGGTQTKTDVDCHGTEFPSSQPCNTQACSSTGSNNWREVTP